MTLLTWNTRIVAPLVLVCGFFVLEAQAVVVLFKDGYALHGTQIIKEKAPLIDKAAGDIFVIDKPGGMTFIDDGARWTIFPTTSSQIADVTDENKFKDLVGYSPKGARYRGREKLPATAVRPEIIKDWDPKEWTREVKLNDSETATIKHTLKQHISIITPHYIRVGSSTHTVVQFFLTREFSTVLIRTFLSNHPDIQETAGMVDPVKRERLIRFWIQADQLEEADADIEKFGTAAPEHKARVQTLKGEVNALRATKLIAEVERARDAGRHQWAIRTLTLFPKEDIPKSVAEKVTVLSAEYETRMNKFNSAKRLLKELPLNLKPEARFLVDAAKIVHDEVHLDTLSRLEVFTTLAERAEADAKNGRKPSQTPEELLSAAVTGWHLGKVAAETKVDMARRCWSTRTMALEYLRDDHRLNRNRVLEGYLKGSDALPYDELEKLVSLLVPPTAPATLPSGPTTYPLPRTGDMKQAAEFVLRLPDEYQHGRPYPLLILLPDGFEKPADLLAKFGDVPARNGYITAVLKWYDPLQNKYFFSNAERAMLTELIRVLRRSYQVDSDRIYLCGNGDGATMALDYASGHPDLFAALIPINPAVSQKIFVACEYWLNFFQLPVYIVMGDHSGPSVNAIRAVAERWMPKGFPTLVTAYKGRGVEWFPHEIPYLFDWMARKKRVDPEKRLGPPAMGTVSKDGFRSARPADNRFHWLSTSEFFRGNVIDETLGNTPTPAKFYARIEEGNKITVKPLGVKQITVWFGKGMLDYTKPVQLNVGEAKPLKKTITPQIPVLMEDLFERADRQRPYFEKVEYQLFK